MARPKAAGRLCRLRLSLLSRRCSTPILRKPSASHAAGKAVFATGHELPFRAVLVHLRMFGTWCAMRRLFPHSTVPARNTNRPFSLKGTDHQ